MWRSKIHSSKIDGSFKKWGFFMVKMRIFPQILTIIGILVLAFIIQGLLGFKVINTMQDTSLNIFEQNAGELTNIVCLRLDLERIKSNYLTKMTGNTVDSQMENDILQDSEFRTQSLKSIGEERIVQLLNDYETITQIYQSPVSDNNLAELLSLINNFNVRLDNFELMIRDNAYTTLSNSKSYANSSRWKTLAIFLTGLILAVAIGLVVASSISAPLKSVVTATESLARGDLTKNIPVGGSVEVSNMADGLNRAIKSLRELVKGINEQSDTLLIASQELKSASFDTGQSAAQVAKAMEELAKAATEQSEQISQTVEIINLLSNLVRKVTLDTENIAASSERVAESAKLGQKATDIVASQISELYDTTKEVGEVINELSKTSGEISEITTVIQGIAEQTTLLALNAAIEAARSGQHGKGFSVIATETGKLAEQSKQSAWLIAGLINQIQQRITVSVNAINKGINRVEDGKNLVNEANQTFSQIFKTLNENIEQIKAVAKSARKMDASNDRVISAINNIAAIIEESLANTEEVSATAEEQSASTEEVSALAENLAEIANRLKESISVFEI